MPVYEYACQHCGHQFEANQRMSEDPLTKCPKCEENALERLVSQSSFALKGSGWYADGYGSSKNAEKPSGESKDDSKSDSKSDSGASDTKPDKTEKTDSPSKPKAESTGKSDTKSDT